MTAHASDTPKSGGLRNRSRPPFIRPAAAAARRSVTFAAAGGLFQDVYEPAILEPFGQAHRDISVFYYPAQSSTGGSRAYYGNNANGRKSTSRCWISPRRGSPPTKACWNRCRQDPSRCSPNSRHSASIPGIAGRAVFSEPLVIVFDAARIAAPASWKSLWSELD